MLERLRTIMKDVLIFSSALCVFSGAYFGFAAVERYRALTAAYIEQSEQLIQILNQQNFQNRSTPNGEEKADAR